MALIRTSGIVLILSVISNVNSETKFPDDTAVPDSALALLRGSEDLRTEVEDEDSFLPNQNSAIEPEKVFLETDLDYDQRPVERQELESKSEPKTTTESLTTISDITKSDPENNYYKGDSGNNITKTVFVNNVPESEIDVKGEVKTNTTEDEIEIDNIEDTNKDPQNTMTEEDATTLSAIDNTVYKHGEDIDNATSHDQAKETISITPDPTVSPTAQVIEVTDDSLQQAELPDDPDLTGQRNPKTDSDNTITKPPIDKRNNDGKTIQPQASKSSTLKNWLEDAWLRPPAGILVPLRPTALNRALAVWNDLVAVERLNVSDIVIVGYDSNGVGWRSRHNLQTTSTGNGNKAVSEALSKLLLKYQGIHTDSSADGTMRALSSAAKLVPYDSALFVVTDRGAGDSQRLPLALRALVEKRLKVYTIWTDPNHPSLASELELQELKNISRHTEGGVLPYSLQVMDIDGSINSAEENWHNGYTPPRRARLYAPIERDHYDTLLVQRGGGGATSLGIPVENGVTALRVHIEGAVEHAVLYPPNDGAQIDLYNQTSVMAFSTTSKADGLSPRDVFLGFPGADFNKDGLSVVPMSVPNAAPAPTVGLWHLSIRCDTCDYRLTVSARARIHLDHKLQNELLHLRVVGPVASVRESMLIDEYGTELAKLPFSYQPTAGDAQDAQDGADAELVSDIPLPNVKGPKIYVKIVGRDVRGEPFARLCGPIYTNGEARMSRSATFDPYDLERVEEANLRASEKLQYNNSSALSADRAASQVINQQGNVLTSVQIGLSSRLYGSPGDNLQLHFEVTNHRNQAVQFAFEAVGELRFLTGITPARQVVGAGQTVNVIVSVSITSTAQPGARDFITFTAYSANAEQVSISAYVYVVNPDYNAIDLWPPEVRHNFQGSCTGRLGDDCSAYVWSTTVTARDGLGGLLRLSSTPAGLLYDSNFISGTRDEVMATYRATCCSPRVMVTAVDAYGNANSYIIDISAYFTEAAIAAIVLGVFLIIIVILLIIFLIYWCVKKNKESRELPTYSTSRSRSLG